MKGLKGSIFIVPAVLISAISIPVAAFAQESPQEQRHELMEGVGDAAKPVGAMLKGEAAFDAATVMQSFQTFADAASKVGALFPEGTETGHDTLAKSTIWSDRAGFDANLKAWSDAIDAAIVAAPQDLDALNAAAGPVFKECKSCHEAYRLEKE